MSYSPENLTLTNNTVSIDLPLLPTLSGAGVITSWELNGSLPDGLNFGTSNGTFWGTPTVLQIIPVTYTVWANNSGGSTSATINITIVDQVPILSYSPENLTLYNNTVSSFMPLGAILTGPGNITSWEIEGDLPAGLNFAMSNGMIWGIPTALQLNPVTYTIWANNSGGSTSANINITVLHKAPMFTYSADNLTLVNNTLMTTVNAINTGGYITSWEIEPAVPNGLILSPLLGSISGTPQIVYTSVNPSYSIANGDIVYEDAGLSSPFDGDDTFYWIDPTCSITATAYADIDNDGELSSRFCVEV